jgi:hypothetical protein
MWPPVRAPPWRANMTAVTRRRPRATRSPPHRGVHRRLRGITPRRGGRRAKLMHSIIKSIVIGIPIGIVCSSACCDRDRRRHRVVRVVRRRSWARRRHAVRHARCGHARRTRSTRSTATPMPSRGRAERRHRDREVATRRMARSHVLSGGEWSRPPHERRTRRARSAPSGSRRPAPPGRRAPHAVTSSCWYRAA